ncbi:MAG: hypothetical protein ACOZNI_26745 [Myxococcota bacterium]
MLRLRDAVRLAVVDIGSNTTSLAVFALTPRGALDRIAEDSEPLRLMRRLGPDGRLGPGAADRTMEALRRFVAEARAEGARTVHVVATSAVRDAEDGEALVDRIATELGVEARVLDGAAEGVAAAAGVVNTLPVRDGFLVDLGGGSLQVVELRGGRCARRASLPLGALRLTDAFLGGDGVPSPMQVTALRRHVQRELAAVPWLKGGGTLVGVGGTIRAIAKIDRRASQWPITHGHGYRLTEDAVEAAWERVSRVDAARRKEIPGLASHRVDLVVAGALVVAWVLRVSGFPELRTCTYGVREGVALQRLFGEDEPVVADQLGAGLEARFPLLDPAQRARAEAARAADPDPLAGAAAWIRIAEPDRAEAVRTLLDAPMQGVWQEDVLGLADLVRREAAPR